MGLSSRMTACGYIVRDRVRKILIMGAMSLHRVASILTVVPCRIREGIYVVVTLGIKNVCLEGYNIAIINSLINSWKFPSEINSVVSDAGVV